MAGKSNSVTFDDTTGNTDWPRGATWDVRTKDGDPVATLSELARVLEMDEDAAAAMLLSTPFGKAAPAELRAEAEALTGEPGEPIDLGSLFGEGDPNPEVEVEASIFDEVAVKGGFVPFVKGGGKAEEAGKGHAKVKRGEFVSWSGGRGKVDLVITGGVVPGVDGKPVFGSKTGPAARVRKYVKDGNGWKATEERVAAKASDLTKIDDLEPKSKGKSGTKDASVGAALVEMAAQHEGVVEAKSLQTSYERGLLGWPGEEKTRLTREQWGLGRARALARAATGTPIPGFADADLLT